MKRQEAAIIPTKWGKYNMIAYATDAGEKMPHIIMVHEGYNAKERVLLRIHSECLTGDLFASKRCDCGEQLERAMELTSAQGGIVIYLRQEGRGIGILNKLKAYNLQDQGLNTIDANTHLGFQADARTYEVVLQVLRDLGVKKIDLLTNNPLKLEVFKNTEFDARRVPIEIPAHKTNLSYLKTKKDKMGHLLQNSLLD